MKFVLDTKISQEAVVSFRSNPGLPGTVSVFLNDTQILRFEDGELYKIYVGENAREKLEKAGVKFDGTHIRVS